MSRNGPSSVSPPCVVSILNSVAAPLGPIPVFSKESTEMVVGSMLQNCANSGRLVSAVLSAPLEYSVPTRPGLSERQTSLRLGAPSKFSVR